MIGIIPIHPKRSDKDDFIRPIYKLAAKLENRQHNRQIEIWDEKNRITIYQRLTI